MKSWFTSLNGAITLSVIALLTELWRAFVNFQYSAVADHLLGCDDRVRLDRHPRRSG
jgi:hypothetical protein